MKIILLTLMISKYNSMLITPPLTDITNITYSIKSDEYILKNIPILPNYMVPMKEIPCSIQNNKKNNFILPTAIFILINYVNMKWNKIKLEKQLEKEKKIEDKKYREYMLKPMIFY